MRERGARGRGAPEFFLLPGDITYWQPADSLAILKLIAAGATTQAATLHVTNLTLTRRASFDSQPLISTGEMSLR